MGLNHILDDCADDLRNSKRVFVGYSGGLDSTVLLHSTVGLLGADKVCALHVNHKLQPESDQWQAHCRNQAQNLGVEFRDAQLTLSNQGRGLEDQARQYRYEFFREQLESGDILVLGHHIDDQAETLLYRLFRGSGARGLSAIPVQRAEGRGKLIRPFLNKPRDKLRDIALEAQLAWIEDPSNFDIGYDRNYIRSAVLPKILERWPAAKTTLARASANLASTTSLLEEYGLELLKKCDWRQARWGWSFDVVVFEAQSSAAQAHLLSAAFGRLNLQGFDSSYLNKVSDLLLSAEDKSPILKAGNSELRRFADRLYLMPMLPPFNPQSEFSWNGKDRLEIEHIGRLSPSGAYEGGDLRITFRNGGERCKPLKRDRSQLLKKIMQEDTLEPWLRDRTPLIWRDSELLAVAGLFSCSTDLPTPELEWKLT